jgi:hypothetical protein
MGETFRKNKEAWGVGFNLQILQVSMFPGGSPSRRQAENSKEKQEGTGGVGFNPQVCRFLEIARAPYKGAKAQVSRDVEFPLFEHASDKGIMG